MLPYGYLDCPTTTVNGVEEKQQGHHVVADRAFRSGGRNDYVWDQNGYVGGMSEGSGLAICLTGNSETPGSEHNIATKDYDRRLGPSAILNGGVVSLGDAEQTGAETIEKATNGRCKSAEILRQLRLYHQAMGLTPDTLVRQQVDPLDQTQTQRLGNKPQAIPYR